jgi:hypothetical protein
MGLPRRLLSACFLCEDCCKETSFLPIPFAVAPTGVSRSTIYKWMRHAQVHWLELPSGRRRICLQSLHRRLATRAYAPRALWPNLDVWLRRSGTLDPLLRG